MAVGVGGIGHNGLPVHWGGEIGGGFQDVRVLVRAGELPVQAAAGGFQGQELWREEYRAVYVMADKSGFFLPAAQAFSALH